MVRRPRLAQLRAKNRELMSELQRSRNQSLDATGANDLESAAHAVAVSELAFIKQLNARKRLALINVVKVVQNLLKNNPNAQLSERKEESLEEEKPEPAGLWQEFCEEVSIEGFQYLSKDVPASRRWFYTIVVVSFLAITCYQTGQVFVKYHRSPVYLKNEKDYPTEIAFPTVVLCNTMPWRVSAVEPKGEMHWALTETFEDEEMNVTKAKYPKIHGVFSKIENIKDFMLKVAHQKEDMIVRCRWRNQPCGHENFTWISTSEGICYRFNYDAENPLTVTAAGKTNGLNLVLNVATYEEMNGQFSTFGMKIAITDQKSPPLLDKAVNAQIGQAAYIGLFVKRVERVDHQCGSKELELFDHYSREGCRLEKLLKYVTEECQCVAYLGEKDIEIANGLFSMSDYLRILVSKQCSLADRFTCTQPAILKPPASTLHGCPEECIEVSYRSMMSSAAVAWDQIERSFISVVPTLIGHMEKAKEYGRRYIPHTKAQTLAIFNNITAADKHYLMIMREIQLAKRFLQELPEVNQDTSVANFEEMFSPFRKENLQPAVSTMQNFVSSFNESIQAVLETFQREACLTTMLEGEADLTDQEVSSRCNSIVTFLPRFGRPSVQESATGERIIRSRYRVSLKMLTTFVEMVIKTHADVRRRLEVGIRQRFYSDSQGQILSRADEAKLFELQQRFALAFLGAEDKEPPGCLQKPFKETAFSHKTETSITDLFICLLVRFSNDGTRLSNSYAIRAIIQSIPGRVNDPEAQLVICEQVLCDALKEVAGITDDDDGLPVSQFAMLNCSYLYPVANVRQLVENLVGALSSTLETCQQSFEDTLAEFDNFIYYYENSVLAAFRQERAMALRMKDEYMRLHALYDEVLYIAEEIKSVRKLEENIHQYERMAITYKELSLRTVENTSVWLENFDVAKSLKDRLRKVVLVCTDFEDASNKLHRVLMDDKDSTNGVIVLIAHSMLWDNSTEPFLTRASQSCNSINRYMTDILGRIDEVQETHKLAVRQIITDAQQYLHNLHSGSQFYKENFLIANIHLAEMAIEVSSQQYKLEFWNLMVDLGGASGLWMGMTVLTLVQIFEFPIRLFNKKMHEWKARLRHKREAKHAAKNERHDTPEDPKHPPNEPDHNPQPEPPSPGGATNHGYSSAGGHPNVAFDGFTAPINFADLSQSAVKAIHHSENPREFSRPQTLRPKAPPPPVPEEGEKEVTEPVAANLRRVSSLSKRRWKQAARKAVAKSRLDEQFDRQAEQLRLGRPDPFMIPRLKLQCNPDGSYYYVAETSEPDLITSHL